jgi:hypothetical protein
MEERKRMCFREVFDIGPDQDTIWCSSSSGQLVEVPFEDYFQRMMPYVAEIVIWMVRDLPDQK